MNVFITGTDTGVGKTIITGGLAGALRSLGYKIAVYKPLQSGAETDDNGQLYAPDLKFVCDIDKSITTRCSYLLKIPAAPSISAQYENVEVDIDQIQADYKELSENNDIVLVEGAGGITVPLYKLFTVTDLIKLLDIPVIIVARPNLGTINHTVLTVEYARKNNIKVIGIIISGYPVNTGDIAIKTAPDIIQQLTQIENIAIIPEIKGISEDQFESKILIEEIKKNINLTNWLKLL